MEIQRLELSKRAGVKTKKKIETNVALLYVLPRVYVQILWWQKGTPGSEGYWPCRAGGS